MKLTIGRHWMEIIPESEQDVAYLEEVIGLKSEGAGAEATRENAFGLSCRLSYMKIAARPARGEK